MIRVSRLLMALGEWLQIRSIALAWKIAPQREAMNFTNKYLRQFGRELVHVDDLAAEALKYPRPALGVGRQHKKTEMN